MLGKLRKMKLKEIRNLEKNAINQKIAEMKKELVKLNAQIAVGTALKNPGQVRRIKKTIARMLTLQHASNKNIVRKKENKKQETGVDKKV